MRAAWETIRLTKERFVECKLWLEGDANSVITELQVWHDVAKPSVMLEDARRMLMGMEVYRITHIYREGNKCADLMTKWIRGRESQVLRREDLPWS